MKARFGKLKGVTLCLALCLASSAAWAENRFYTGLNYGSESQFHPATVFLNGAYDILRNPSYRANLFDLDYGTGFSNLWKNLRSPGKTIDDGGFGRFAAHELFPYKGLGTKYGQFIPNYVLHTFGEGMLTRKLTEWYRAHDVFWPHFWGISTVMAMQFVNEAVENGSFEGTNADPISDIYFFNVLGYVLFSFDAVADFFSGDPVQLNYWPHQAAIDLRSGELFNHGQNFAFKFGLGNWTDWRLFTYFGVEGLLGVAVPLNSQDDFSIGGGVRLLELAPDTEPGSRILVPKGALNVELGLFWDRHESLMASAFLGGPGNWLTQVNVYPGVFRLDGFQLGLYAMAAELEGISVGLSVELFSVVPGLLFGKNRSKEVF